MRWHDGAREGSGARGDALRLRVSPPALRNALIASLPERITLSPTAFTHELHAVLVAARDAEQEVNANVLWSIVARGTQTHPPAATSVASAPFTSRAAAAPGPHSAMSTTRGIDEFGAKEVPPVATVPDGASDAGSRRSGESERMPAERRL